MNSSLSLSLVREVFISFVVVTFTKRRLVMNLLAAKLEIMVSHSVTPHNTMLQLRSQVSYCSRNALVLTLC